jgi:thiaminase/transcriptional activator TenA
MAFAQELMDSVADLWERCSAHPFVTALAAGAAPRERFRDYLIQDTLYLKEYTKVFAIAFVKADDIAVMRHLYGDMQCVLSDETQTHIAYLRDFGVTEADALAAPVAAPNRAYLDFMLATARAGDWLDGYIATMPCTLSYFHVARRARAAALAAGTLEDNYYRAWADFYAGPEYEAVYRAAVAFIDTQTAAIGPEARRRLTGIFRTSSEHELAFWDMAQGGGR